MKLSNNFFKSQFIIYFAKIAKILAIALIVFLLKITIGDPLLEQQNLDEVKRKPASIDNPQNADQIPNSAQ